MAIQRNQCDLIAIEYPDEPKSECDKEMPFAESETVEFAEYLGICWIVIWLFCVDIHELLIMSLKIEILDILLFC